jgi:hypothetical protein
VSRGVSLGDPLDVAALVALAFHQTTQHNQTWYVWRSTFPRRVVEHATKETASRGRSRGGGGSAVWLVRRKIETKGRNGESRANNVMHLKPAANARLYGQS